MEMAVTFCLKIEEACIWFQGSILGGIYSVVNRIVCAKKVCCNNKMIEKTNLVVLHMKILAIFILILRIIKFDIIVKI